MSELPRSEMHHPTRPSCHCFSRAYSALIQTSSTTHTLRQGLGVRVAQLQCCQSNRSLPSPHTYVHSHNVGVRAACFESERVEQRPVRPSSQYRRCISKPTGEPLSIRDECIRPSGPACAASNIVRVPRSSHTIAAPLSVTRAARHQRPKHPAAESSASRPN